MNKLLALSMAFSSLFLIGCGAQSDGEANSSETGLDLNASVTFDSQGAFDLKEYMAPPSSRTNDYAGVMIDAKGEQTAASQTLSYSVSGNSWRIGSTAFQLSDVKISGSNSSAGIEYARYVDVGDYVLKSDNTTFDLSSLSSDFQGDVSQVCKLAQFYATKNYQIAGQNYGPFDDVLEMKCRLYLSGTVDGERGTIDVNVVQSFAKGIGSVYEKMQLVVSSSETSEQISISIEVAKQ